MDTIYIRKFPNTCPEHVTEADGKFVCRETKIFLRSVGCMLEELGVRVVNPLTALEKAALKPLQLMLARKIGFRVPKTLISNDPEHVIPFARNLGPCIVVKTLSPMVWVQDPKRYHQTMATKIATSELNRNTADIGNCPVLIQELIYKYYDVKCLVVGDDILSISIHADDTDSNIIDWRETILRGSTPELAAVELPDDIREKVLRLVRYLGLDVATVDLVYERKTDEYVFLEVNPTGQWLWMDMRMKNFPATRAVASLLTGKKGSAEGPGLLETFSEKEIIEAISAVYRGCRPYRPYVTFESRRES
ncbi:MAG: hypothetical protein D6800_07155 [Candidatus Zixiibacteriota bacterium]|nr:MAG: hypothetical protein D6800_07155 [candidate division Zixibacteria bacterium]